MAKLTLQLHKKHCQRQVGVLEKLYSGTFYPYRYSVSKHFTKVTLGEIAGSP
jgi:hypothetical protein